MKKIFLFFIVAFLLTSCVSIKQIDYTNNSTVLDKSNQELYQKLLNDINIKYVYINNLTDFDEYLQHLNTLSEISYTYIKNSEKLTEESIEVEIDLQKKIIKTLKNLSISKEMFSSEESFLAAKDFISDYLIKLIDTRINYLELAIDNLNNTSTRDSSSMSLIDIATIPNLEATGQKLREKFLN